MLRKRKLCEEEPPTQQRGRDCGRVRCERSCQAASGALTMHEAGPLPWLKNTCDTVTSALDLASGRERRDVVVLFPRSASGQLTAGSASAVTVLSFADWRALERSDDVLKSQLAYVWCAADTTTLVLRPDEMGQLSELRGWDLRYATSDGLCDFLPLVLWLTRPHRWHALLRQLEVRRQVLLEMTAHISTLGGGWASVGQRSKAHQYAYQQKRVARLLGDETLELLSDVYIAYGHLSEGRLELARNIIAAQTTLAQRRGDRRQLAIVDAARIQLAKLDGAAAHKTTI